MQNSSQQQLKKTTKLCPFCAEEIKAEAIKCKHCGSDLPIEDVNIESKEIKANDHKEYGLFTLLSFLIPPAGFILGIIYLAKENPLDKKLGEHSLAISIAFSIGWWIVLSILQGSLGGI